MLSLSDRFYSDKYDSKRAAFLTGNVTSRRRHLLRYDITLLSFIQAILSNIS